MPSFPAEDLLQQLLNSFEESGANAVLISPLEQRHPRVFVVQSGDKVEQIWVYIWTLTHGGGYRRPRDEFRIQLTGVEPPLQLNPNGPTLLLGYEAARGCFAGFDIRKHLTFTPGSPSIQIRISVLDDAQRDGIAFGRKGNEEIAVGFRSDYLLPYAVNSEVLHQQAIDPATVALMGKAARQGIVEPQDIQAIVPARQRVVVEVARFTRAAGFRRRVVDAYASTCAATRMRLRLVDAAHILPVGAEGSTDETANGVCLSATFHRAFDSALIFLDEGYAMRLNQERAEELQQQGLGAGLELILAHLDKPIALPRNPSQWPDTGMIRKANEFRQIRTSAQ